ncbi:trypsin-like serine peptidase [Paludibacterium paludis]|nr:trypsin-like serine protease [Paludibacterium paludis]
MPLRRLSLLLPLLLLPLSLVHAEKLTKEQLTLFFGKDDRVVVRPDSSPWQSIGQITTKGGLECTATLVAPDVALTAGHCFLGPQGRMDPAESFTLGLVGDRYKERVAASEVYVSARLLKGLIHRKDGIYIPASLGAWDYAFVRLKNRVGDRFGVIPYFSGSRDDLSDLLERNGMRITQAGYPEDTDNIMMAHKDCRATGLLPDGRLGHHCDTLSGDSGSPIFAFINGKPVIVAIQSSAPDARKRKLADNMGLSTPVFSRALDAFILRKPR